MGRDDPACYIHAKVLDGLLGIHDWCNEERCSHPIYRRAGRPTRTQIVKTVGAESVLSEEQLGIARMLTTLGADDDAVRAALQRRSA